MIIFSSILTPVFVELIKTKIHSVSTPSLHPIFRTSHSLFFLLFLVSCSLVITSCETTRRQKSTPTVDPTLTISSLQSAADSGNIDAQKKLGMLYLSGKRVPVNRTLAYRYFRRAAEQGDAESQFMMGDAYRRGLVFDQDFEQASYWYKQAADQNYPRAALILAKMNQEGVGSPQDQTVASYYFHQAAKTNNDPKAQYLLGLELLKQSKTDPSKLEEAQLWLERAAAQKYRPAIEKLSLLDAEITVRENQLLTRSLRHSAQKGDAQAQYQLAQRYEQGDGVLRSKKNALYWYTQSVQRGNTQAKADQIRLEKEIRALEQK